MGSRGQIQTNAVLKVVNREVCPRIFKYYQKVLARGGSRAAATISQLVKSLKNIINFLKIGF